VSFESPFQVLMPRPLTLQPEGRKPPDWGPVVRVEAVRVGDKPDPVALERLARKKGLGDPDRDGLLEHDNSARNAWRADLASELVLEFELPEPVPLAAMQVWNYNSEWDTAHGVRQASVAVSVDGSRWQTILADQPFAEAEGRADYDEPIVLDLKGVTAWKVRLQNLSPWSGDKVGLSEVVFHQSGGPQPAPALPEDGGRWVGIAQPRLEWLAGTGASEYRVWLGTDPKQLNELGRTKETRWAAPKLAPNSTYYWRVDAVGPDGAVVAGRTARFHTTGMVGWWKLDETEGATAADASGLDHAGRVVGKPRWAPGGGRIGGAMEFDGAETFINCGRGPALEFRDAMTVAAWIKVREFNKPWQAIVTQGDRTWRLQRDNETSKVMFAINGVKGAQADSQEPARVASKRRLDDGQWHHVAALYDGQRLALYVDGLLEDSLPASGTIAADDQPVMIGCNPAAYARRFNGWIDDVRLYGYALGEDEIKALARGTTEQAAR